jgi:murein DD-endopeptidase MepM/ murein hydrolase activator NlpD
MRILCLLLGLTHLVPYVREEPRPPAPLAPTAFVWPCENYDKGLQAGGNFGTHVDAQNSPFHGSWHLAEDVWLPAGTPVRAIADGVVRYSAFSPTWTDAQGGVHWNLGNVIVIEHALVPPVGEQASVCSFYVHLGSDRRVAVGDRVTRGTIVGRIGADRSEENGRYPAHLHFGLHRGPYYQIPPAFRRELETKAASKDGLRVGNFVFHGELSIRLHDETSVLVASKESGTSIIHSLLVGSTAPKDPPPDIMCWCEGYGAESTLAEWWKPSAFLRERSAAEKPGAR